MSNQILLNRAKECLTKESIALLSLASELDESYINFITAISACQGKYCFIGVGKSFIVARKIASSFCSLGYASFAIDPLCLLHGELGAIGKDDIVVAVSNSGETKILLDAINAIMTRNITIVSIVGNYSSSLAQISNHVIAIPTSEAGPFGLVPSTSTTVMMAMGDALLCGLAEMDGLTVNTFQSFHPDGHLGQIMKGL